MGKQDLSKILITESEYYNNDCNYVAILRKNGIRTMDQLLDDEVMLPIIKKCRHKTYRQLTTFISLAKYKYLDIQLDNVDLLNETILVYEKLDSFYGEDAMALEGNDNILHLRNILGLSDSYCYYFITKFVENGSSIILNDRVKVIDMLRFMSEFLTKPKEIKLFMPAISANVESYDKSIKKINKKKVDYEEIKGLLIELRKMKATRDELDKQIIDLQQKIEDLSSDFSDDGFQKIIKDNR